MKMANDGIAAALRLAWSRYLAQTTQNMNREKLTNLVFGVSGRQKAKQVAEMINCKLHNTCTLFVRQCNVIAGQRTWRAFQIASWYRQLYGEKRLLQTLRSNLLRQCNKNRQLYMLLCAAGFFQWERDGVTDEELHKAFEEMDAMERLVEHAAQSHSQHTPAPDGWEIVIDRQHLKVWRRFMPEYGLYEYKVFGSFSDITPRAFYNTQMDLKFWSGWDQQTMEINIVDVDSKSNSAVIHWVYRFPYPMYPRDYCYVRRSMYPMYPRDYCYVCRSMMDEEENKLVIAAKAVTHHKCPEVNQVVRVQRYQSQMVIEPHKSIDENGFSYFMNYFDDPKTQLPSVCYSWLASTGVPDFVERLHSAAKVMQERTQHGYQPNVTPTSQTAKEPDETKLPNVQHYL